MSEVQVPATMQGGSLLLAFVVILGVGADRPPGATVSASRGRKLVEFPAGSCVGLHRFCSASLPGRPVAAAHWAAESMQKCTLAQVLGSDPWRHLPSPLLSVSVQIAGPVLRAGGGSSLNNSHPALQPRAGGATEVTVLFRQVAGVIPKKFGGYRSEETRFWDKIYDPARTLRPLQMVANRVQLGLWDAELGPDGAFLDPNGTQLGIIQKVAQSVEEVFITVGVPQTKVSKQYVADEFKDPAWEDYYRRMFVSVADALASAPYYPGRPVWIELFGEPDLWLWDGIYGKDEQRIFYTIKMAYDAFARYPEKFKIGGCGFAFLWDNWENTWVTRFLDYSQAAGMAFAFYSYHSYLGWTDRTNPADYPFAPTGYWNMQWRNNRFLDMLKSRGLGSVPIVVSEYSWPDADGAAAAGFNNTGKGARFSITRWKSCARTLQAIDIMVNESSVARVFWAQGVGRFHTPTQEDTYRSVSRTSLLGQQPRAGLNYSSYKYVHSYFPFVVYDQFTGDVWHYKASYYAFWIYGWMKGARVGVRKVDPALGVWASKGRSGGSPFLWVAVWNRSNQDRFARVALPGLQPALQCTMYLVDDSTFILSAGGLDAVVSGPTSTTPPIVDSVLTVGDALAFTQTRMLRKEGTIFLAIKLR